MVAEALDERAAQVVQRRVAKKVAPGTAKKRGVVKTKVKTRNGGVTAFSVYAPGASQAALKKADFVVALRQATTMDLVEIERQGVPAQLFAFLADRLDVPLSEVLRITGAPRSTTLRKLSAGERLNGTAGQAALGVTRLLAKAREMADESTHPDAASFDVSRWFGEWIRKPQPALGGRKPEELLDTPTGLDAVMRVLGAIQSGVSI